MAQNRKDATPDQLLGLWIGSDLAIVLLHSSIHQIFDYLIFAEIWPRFRWKIAGNPKIRHFFAEMRPYFTLIALKSKGLMRLFKLLVMGESCQYIGLTRETPCKVFWMSWVEFWGAYWRKTLIFMQKWPKTSFFVYENRNNSTPD